MVAMDCNVATSFRLRAAYHVLCFDLPCLIFSLLHQLLSEELVLFHF